MAEVRRHPKMSRRAAAEVRRRRRTNTVRRHPSSDTPMNRRPASPRVKRRRVVLSSVLGGLSIIAFLFAFVYPTSTYLQQRSDMRDAQHQLDRIKGASKRLELQTKRLQGDAEVERIAREQYGLVRPGETPYVLVPSTSVPTAPAG